MIMRTSAELKQFLYGQGAGLVGIGNMEGIENCRFQTGVAIAVPLPPRAVAALREAPTLEYLDLYHALNQKLDEIVLAGERFLQNAGHNALAQTTARVKADGDNISPLPHKTVATRAGLGWIGKSGLLVTPQYGGAIRLSSLLTDAELDYDEPVVRSRCGTCGLCVEQCPAGALRGALWEAGGCSLGELTQALYEETGWNRNTVLTYLTRMEAKGLVAIEKAGYPRRYRAALSREDCRAQARDSFLRQVYRGSTGDLVAAFLKEKPISPEERAALRRLLDEMEV